jgi:hypothetical protein
MTHETERSQKGKIGRFRRGNDRPRYHYKLAPVGMYIRQPAFAFQQRLAHVESLLEQHSEVDCKRFPSNAGATAFTEGRTDFVLCKVSEY